MKTGRENDIVIRDEDINISTPPAGLSDVSCRREFSSLVLH